MRIRLTKRAIESAREAMLAIGKARAILWDTEVVGFGCDIRPNLASLFFRYRAPDRRERHMTIARLGEGTVDQARDRAAEIKLQVRAGADPAGAIKAARKAVERQSSLRDDVDRWMKESSQSWSATTRRTYRQTIERHVLSRFGARPLAGIERRDWRDLLVEVATETPSLATLLRRILGSFMQWAIDSERLTASPLPSPKRVVPKVASRSRVLSDEEIVAIWEAAGALEVREAALTRFVILTASRSGAAASLDRRWIRDDGSIVFPGAVMKGGEDHRVSLSAWAWDQIAPALNHRPAGPLVFADPGKSPIASGPLLDKLRERVGLTDWRFHDLRRSFRSWAAKSGIGRDAAETCLAHRIHRNEVEAAYQKHRFEAEAEDAFHRWQEHIQWLVTGAGGTVVPLRRRSTS
jgi:integrase